MAVCRFPRVLSLLALAVLALLSFEKNASAQIKSPGAHPHYNVELEPHFVLQWDDEPWGDDGLGVGLRASIPIVDNGPVSTINNNLAIGFGLDWAHFGNGCWGYYRGIVRAPGYDCSADSFWLPAVAQWNFFFTDVVSGFAELGLGIQHTTWHVDCGAPNNGYCGSHSNTDANVLFFVGPRFLLSDNFAITLRIGVPYLSLGASFLL